MTLTTGSRVGPYEIADAIGAGGMGEVYRGRDSRLKRDVAIKVLPALFADDPERLGRFEREAQTLAALNHPHIATIFGIENGPGGSHALIMELVDGDTLAEHIERAGKRALPLRDTLTIARQIAEGLEAAHEKGIIHRDLKPANIKLTSDGSVKILDFGLAKAMESESLPASAGAINSPTFTARATQVGMLLGTAAYMAPEQARGRSVDRRADIWSFGCVLFEMITGRRAFEGEEITDVLARVIEREPDWSAIPASTPSEVRRLLTRCLSKDSKSNESGRMEVYLRTLGGADRKWPVSSQGGLHSLWSRDGKKIYYRSGQQMMVVDFTAEPRVRLSAPRVLFEKRFSFGQSITLPNVSLSADGAEFLMVQEMPGGRHLDLVLNWLPAATR